MTKCLQERTFEPSSTVPNARIVVHERDLWRVELLQDKKVLTATITGRLRHENSDLPIVGDYVFVEQYEGAHETMARISAIAPRKSLLKRSVEAGKQLEQNIAANIDVVLIVTSLNQDLNLRRLERMLVLTWNAGCLPAIVLTKSDLGNTPPEALKMVAAGAPILITSIFEPSSIESLKEFLQPGKTYCLIGSSGVGKSSLVNALTGLNLATQGVRIADDRGRHTTTNRHLHRLANDAFLIDSPGIRGVGLSADEDALDSTFAEIDAIIANCKYSNCQHKNEDGCAINAAIASEEVTRERWHAYEKLQRELAFQQRKSDKHLQAAEKRKWKTIHKAQKVHYQQKFGRRRES